MGSGKKVISGVVWTMAVNVVNAIYGFISVPLLISYFGKSEYGLIGLAMSINVYLRLLDMGFDSTNVRFFSTWLAEKKLEKVRIAFQTSLSFYGIIGLLNAAILLVLSVFSDSIFNVDAAQDIILKRLIYILCFTAFLSWVMSCFSQMVKATENVAYIQKCTLLTKILLIIVLFGTVYGRLSIEMYFALSCVVALAVIPFYVRKIRRETPFVRFWPKIDWPTFKEMLPYSLNIFSFSIFQFSFYNLRPMLLGMQGTMESVADFKVLNGIAGLVSMFGGTFLGALLPTTSRVVAQHNKEAYYRVAYSGTRYVSIIMSFCCFGIMSVAAELLTVYVGREYLYLVPWLYFWLMTLLFTHNQAISSLILAGTDIRAITYSSIIASVAGLVVTWFTIPAYQVGGTVIGYVVYILIQMGFYYLYYWPQKMKINSVKVFFNCFAPYAAIGGAALLVAYFVNVSDSSLWNGFAKGLLFAVLFAAATWCVMPKDEKSYLMGLMRKQKV
ncbi:MAG: oligosaccharide flippase family protein [Salinivirgaceae bacterium]|nr:oligosaccharide flippase family protein [Salinivirgaceae bacterium]